VSKVKMAAKVNILILEQEKGKEAQRGTTLFF
jgi:hypothetical protein